MSERRYAATKHYVTKRIGTRGYIWEGARPAYESGKYHGGDIERLLRDGVIAPHPDSSKGYIRGDQE